MGGTNIRKVSLSVVMKTDGLMGVYLGPDGPQTSKDYGINTNVSGWKEYQPNQKDMCVGTRFNL